MPEDFKASELNRFVKAKGTPRPVRVLGGLRDVYLNPGRIRAVNGKNINGTRSSSATPKPASAPPRTDRS